jgi:hypothetical protein
VSPTSVSFFIDVVLVGVYCVLIGPPEETGETKSDQQSGRPHTVQPFNYLFHFFLKPPFLAFILAYVFGSIVDFFLEREVPFFLRMFIFR